MYTYLSQIAASPLDASQITLGLFLYIQASLLSLSPLLLPRDGVLGQLQGMSKKA